MIPQTLDKCWCDGPLQWENELTIIDYLHSLSQCAVCGTRYERNGLTNQIYEMKSGGSSFTHLNCGAEILRQDVRHSVEGSGEVRVEQIPYCPKHEDSQKPLGRSLPPKEAKIDPETGAIDMSSVY